MGGEVYAVRGGAIVTPERPLLRELDFEVREGSLTAVLGPGGTGKSSLLRVLGGLPLTPGWRLEGRWSFRGGPLTAAALAADGGIVWLPQRSRAWSANGGAVDASTVAEGGAAGGIEEALAAPARVLLVDERVQRAPADERRRAVEALRRRVAAGAAAVVVTHDLGLARELADRVLLIAAGRIVAQGAAPEFFAEPPNELAAQFVAHGNCWVPPPQPELPSHFHWLVPGKLAGMGRPGLLGAAEEDLAAIAQAGVTLLISLTSQGLPATLLRPFGLTGRHLPIVDMGVPRISSTARLCRDIERALANGEVVAVHCHAGLGRTGLVLASVLVWLGLPPAEAIARVRAVVPAYIQNRAQEDFIARFAAASTPAPSGQAAPHPLLAALERS